jgi:outer membrane protein assembly factor BamB
MRFGLFFMVAISALGLAACSEKAPPKLAGDRIDITAGPTLLQPDPTAGEVAFDLPAPTAQENWAQTGGNAAHAMGNIELPQGVVRAWTYRMGGGTGPGKALLGTPVVHSGRLFAMNTDRDVVAVNAVTGKKIWSITLPSHKKKEDALTGGLAVLGNLLFITTGEGKVYALTASTGKQVWMSDLAVPIRVAPTAEGERVFVISHDNRLFALNALDGSLAWTHSGMEETLSLLGGASPAVGNGMIAVPYSSGEIYLLRSTDGRYIWHDTLTSPFTGQDPDSMLSSIAAAPVMADGLLYVVGLNGGLSSYGLVNGQRFWRVGMVSSQAPVVAGAQMFMVTDRGELVALNRKDGAIRWVRDLNDEAQKLGNDKSRYWSGPVLAGSRLVVVNNKGLALSLDPQSGKRVAATDLDEPVSLPPVVANDGLYFLTDSAKIIAFRKEK